MFRTLIHCLIVLCLIGTGAAMAKSKAPIRIAITGETQQVVMARIAGAALKKAGFKVEYVETASTDLIAALSDAKVHVHPEYPVSGDAAYEAALAEKEIRTLGGRNGNGRDEPVQKLVWGGMKKKWPYARKMLKTMIFPTDELQALAARADAEGVDPVVADWMKQNRKRWKRWVSASTNWMKP